MGDGQRNIRVTSLGRFARGRRPDRNPLRRASDRLETAMLALLLIVFAAAAPFVAQAGAAWARARAHDAQLSQEASWHQVSAQVLKMTTGVQGGGGYGELEGQAQARWTAPDGKAVTGEIPVPPATAVGTMVPLWITSDGTPTDPPLQDSQVADDAAVAGTVSVIALAVLLTGSGMLARRALDKRRMAAWDVEWRTTGPSWTTRT
jgi:uncharacterized membrane protein YhaH (DUF805 family)